ncbi:MAG: phenylacetate--CoA ligase family protein, partial [Rubripirellula sp.]
KRPFYGRHHRGNQHPLESLSELSSLPMLAKDQVLGEAAGHPARIFDLPRTDYTRLHQTSGTKGFPMTVLDTPSDWAWWLT